jgi:alpha-glucoside transport system permease protein
MKVRDSEVDRYALRSALSGTTLRATIAILCFIWTLPTVGLFVSSFRSASAIRTSGWWTAFETPFEFTQWTLENYSQVITSVGLGNAFPGRELFFTIVVALTVAPIQMALIPVLRLHVALNLNGTFLGVWLAHTGFGIPMAVYLLYNFISQIPRDLIEAASIDGASHFQTFMTLVLRVSVPALASFAVFQFIWVWNDLIVALVFLGTRSSVATVTAALSELIGSRGQDWHLLTAGGFVSIILPMVVFFSLQRFFVRGILAGSVKG